MARVALPQSKIRARRKKRRIMLAASAAGVLVAAIGLLAWASHASFMRIHTIEVEDADTVSKESIVAAVREELDDSYFYLFPKDNIFLYPKFSLQHAIPKKISTLSKVDVKAVNFQTLKVTVKERVRKALWCGASQQSSDACFWLDQDGVAYAATSDLTLSLTAGASVYEKYYGPLSGTSSPRQFLSQDNFKSLSALVDAIAEHQNTNTITSISVNTAGVVRVAFKNDFTLIFMLTSPGADVYQRFILALTSDVFVAHTLDEFSYLDLRFGDKLYYKLK